MSTIGKLTSGKKPVASDAVPCKCPEDVDSLKPGDVVRSWDFYFEWDGACPNTTTRKEWRSQGDPVCDAALHKLLTKASCVHGVDLLSELENQLPEETRSATEGSDLLLTDFWEEITATPPPGIATSPEQLERAQSFFASHGNPIIQALMHFSLAGGFASPRITRVLRSVSYLVPPNGCSAFPNQESKERVVSRLMETLQWVVDIMGGNIPPKLAPEPETSGERKSLPNGGSLEFWKGAGCWIPGHGEGWKSTIRVRMLHAVARRRILDKVQKHSNSNSPNKTDITAFYDPSTDGVPINQEDLAYTLVVFSYAPLHCLGKLGHWFTQEDAEDYIALWRHVGWYMGVSEEILTNHFSSFARAEKFSAACGQMLWLELSEDRARYADEPEGPQAPTPPTLAILGSLVGGAAWMSEPIEHRVAFCRYLLGDRIGDMLELPPASSKALLRLRWKMLLTSLPYYFGAFYVVVLPTWGRGWERRRRDLTLEAFSRAVRWRLGMRRTTFRPREADGRMVDGVEVDEKVEKDDVGLRDFRKRGKKLLLEMVVVAAGFTILTVYGVYLLWHV